MRTPTQIAYSSVISTSRTPRWWILALVQVAAFAVMGELLRPHWPTAIYACWLICALAIIIPTTVQFWHEIQADREKAAIQISSKMFIKQCLTAEAILLLALVIIVAARWALLPWVFLVVISSLVAATAILAMLYAVLRELPFNKALASALYTWNKKASMGAIAALILILAQGASFALVSYLRKSLEITGQFSLLSHSATIWILLAAIIFLVGVLAAVLNCFLVNLFLEIIQSKKAPEEIKPAVVKLEASGAVQ
ncbi:MAG TPA: hypothetical protein VE973_02275 [Candidatus Limnocylindria bacterium]|nr:hypothetical protein [Candidatus Limnocylindria bacterium]